MKHQIQSKSVKKALVIAAIILLPLVYSFFYLAAFWDPYSHLQDLPVAVVNEDQGAVIQGEQRNIGNEIVDNLKENTHLKWIFTNSHDAKSGVEKRSYYAEIYIPKDFSSRIATADTKTKQQGVIVYKPNEKRNFLAAQVLNRVMLELKQNISQNITEEITNHIVIEMKRVPADLKELEDGLAQLRDGSNTLASKLSELSDGQNRFNNGLAQLNSGLADLSKGTSALSQGTDTLHTGLSGAVDGTLQLRDGSAALESGLNDAANGASKLSAGAQQLHSGLQEFYNKLSGGTSDMNTLLQGSSLFHTQLKDMSTGTQQFANSLGTLKSGTAALSSGASSLADNMGAFHTGITTYVDSVDQLITVNENISGALQSYIKAHPEAVADKYIQQILAVFQASGGNLGILQQSGDTLKQSSSALLKGSQDLSAGSQSVDSGMGTAIAFADKISTGAGLLAGGYSPIDQGIQKAGGSIKTAADSAGLLAGGAKQLDEGLVSLNQGLSAAKSGSTNLHMGLDTLYQGILKASNGSGDILTGVSAVRDGAAKAHQGSSELAANAGKLADGEQQLLEGAKELHDGLVTAHDKVDTAVNEADSKLAGIDGLGAYAADPVQLQETKINPVPDYGTAFAPYFLSLSFWVGALMMFFGIYFDPDARFNRLSRKAKGGILKQLAYPLIGIGQALVLGMVIRTGLHLEVKNILLYYTICILVSLSFISIVQFLIMHASDVGKFLSIILLILQLTSCGGTFPMELVPGFFNKLYPFMPMTYSVNALKEVISGIDGQYLSWNVWILTAILLVFSITSLIISLRSEGSAVRRKTSEPALDHEVSI